MSLPTLRRGRHDVADPLEKEPREDPFSLVRFILTLIVLAWALRSLIVAPFSIPSGSMLPTLYIGDYLAVAKWPYGYSRFSFPFDTPSFNGRIFSHLPARGDVVVFRHPSEDEDLIKRVIGLPGDTVEIRSGELILNGQPIRREEMQPYAVPISANSPCNVVAGATPLVTKVENRLYCTFPAYRETLPGGPSYTVLNQVDGAAGDEFGPVRVPKDHLFLMGDNRDNSGDSRFSLNDDGIGMVPVDNLIGRAIFTFWSTDGSSSYWKPWTWFTAMRATRVGNGYKGDAQ